MNIGGAAQASGLPAKTIRYYEDIGLVAPARTANGYRDFSAQDIHKLRFLGQARTLGFSVSDCRTLLALYEDTDRASADVKRLATEHLSEIDARIARLQDMRATLSDLVTACAGDARPDCPILSGLGAQPRQKG